MGTRLSNCVFFLYMYKRRKVDAGRHGHDKTHDRTEFVRTSEMEKTIRDARQLMFKCSNMYSEEKCLQIFFGADYFWNK